MLERLLFSALFILGPLVLGLLIIALLARRFARRRRAEGAWDDNGPLHPTDPPLNFLKPRASSFPGALEEWSAAMLERRPLRSLRRWRPR